MTCGLFLFLPATSMLNNEEATAQKLNRTKRTDVLLIIGS